MITINGNPEELKKMVWALSIAHEGLSRYEEYKGSKNLSPIKDKLAEYAAIAQAELNAPLPWPSPTETGTN
jgi:hypothetical protein